jgi:WD40 repeat protein
MNNGIHAGNQPSGRATHWRYAVIAGLILLSGAAMTAAAPAMHIARAATPPQVNSARHIFLTGRVNFATSGLVRQATSRLLAIPSSVKGVTFSPDGYVLAGAYGDGTIRLWNLATGHLYGPVLRAGSGPQPSVNAVAFSPDGHLLASADADGTIQLWNPGTGHPRHPVLRAGSGSQASVNAIAFSPDGHLLASADADGTIQLWNPATSQPLGSPLPAGSSVNGLAFSPDGHLLASADADGTIQLWNPAIGQPVGPPRLVGSGANGVAFSPDGHLLASADADGIIQWWTPDTSQPVGLDTGGWFAILACVIAIVLSAFAVTITARETQLARTILRRRADWRRSRGGQSGRATVTSSR